MLLVAGLSWVDVDVWRHTLGFTHTKCASPHTGYLCVPGASIQVNCVLTIASKCIAQRVGLDISASSSILSVLNIALRSSRIGCFDWKTTHGDC